MEKNHHGLNLPQISSTCAELAEAADPLEDEEVQKLLQTLEQETFWEGHTLVNYKGFWLFQWWLKPVLRIERYFKPRDSDVILSTMPKSGTTWLKALTYSIANRKVHSPTSQHHPLFASNPHELVHTLEVSLYRWQKNPNIDELVPSSPRILSTHISYTTLPETVRESPCKIIYICRNPLDRFVSGLLFLIENNGGFADYRDDGDDDAKKALSIEESFDKFCRGIVPWGPTWEHALGYWRAHLKNPDKVLFLKYEDLMKDDVRFIRAIAEFIGFPFSREEEESGLVEEISKLCSFENLREANNAGLLRSDDTVKRSSFFRKGEVGDWKNYLTKEMGQRMKDVMASKLEGSGLVLAIPGL